jgi:hypothetical protein
MIMSDTKLRRHLSKCLVTAVICVIPATGCTKRREVVTVPPPAPVPVIARVHAPVPLYSPIPASLPDYTAPPLPGEVEQEEADRAFTTGNYDEAILAYESSLLLAPSGERRDEALFRLGICYVLRNSSNSDWQRARTTLQQLINDYPNSSLKPPALVILNLRTRADELSGNIKAREQAMKQLSMELEKLKQIDAERGRFLTP